jgi:hypothetical protein
MSGFVTERSMPASLAGTLRRTELLASLALPSERTQIRLRAVRDGLVIAGLLFSAFVLIVIPIVGQSLGYDAYSYWSVDLQAVYQRTLPSLYQLGAFRYAPPLALLAAPLATVPWWLFLWGWLAVMLGAVLYLGGRWALVALAFPPVALELVHGNVHLLIALAIGVGFRWPWTWSFVLLTKITPGIGLLWFAVRREWTKLAIALGFTALVSLITLAVAPQLWSQWLESLTVSAAQDQSLSIPPPLPIRLPFAVLLVVWGARTNRPWTVGISAMLALPVIWPHGLAVALAALPFLRHRADARHRADPEGSRRRFISVRELFGPDPEGATAALPSPWLAVGLIGGALALAAATASLDAPVLSVLLHQLSALIVPTGA